MKVFLGLLLTFVSCGFQLSHASAVAYWPADGNANDVTGNNNGVLRNGTTFGQGVVGQAFSFDGVDDFVEVPDSNDWAFGSGDFSIAFWTKFSNLQPLGNNNYSMLMAQADDGNNYFQFFLDRRGLPQVSLNSSLFLAFYNAGNEVIRFGQDFDPPEDTWIHFAVVREIGMATLYVDGSPIANDNNVSGSIANLSSALDFGYDRLNNAARLNGLMDEIHLFNQALSPQEVQQLAGIPEPTSLITALICVSISANCGRRKTRAIPGNKSN